MQFTALSIASVLGLSLFSAPSTVEQSAPIQAPKKQVVETQQVLAAKVVTIEPGDSLSSIAEREKTTPERLFYANTAIEQPDAIFPGDTLRIPTADEKLAERPMPTAPAPVAAAPAAVAPSNTSVQRVQAPSIAGGSVWDQLAACEAGGNWAINTGNGFYGGLQFTISSWQAVGGSGLPSDASREEQIMRGQMLQARQGWGAWPACTAKMGLS